MKLKEHQEASLATLRTFFEEARIVGPKTAYETITTEPELAARLSNSDGRKVYAHHELLEGHFSTVSPNSPGLERNDDGPMKGDIRFSFANLMHLHRPLVIMDEAH